MTLSNIASLTGTSVSTVSKAFSGSREVSEDVRNKIFSVAKELGCFEKYYKGPREKYIIAIVCPENESEYYGLLVANLERSFAAKGVDSVIAMTRFDTEREQRIFAELAYRLKVDGVVAIDCGGGIKNPDGIPLFALSSVEIPVENSDKGIIEWEDGLRNAAEHLIECGHTEIGFIGDSYSRSKFRQFDIIMREHGILISERWQHFSSKRFMDAGRDGMKKFLDSGGYPTAVLCSYDYVALGAMEYARECGLNVPEDISFIGFDNLPICQMTTPRLSSIGTRSSDVSDDVVDIILKRIDNRFYRSGKTMKIKTELHKRNSVADRRKKK